MTCGTEFSDIAQAAGVATVSLVYAAKTAFRRNKAAGSSVTKNELCSPTGVAAHW